MQTTSNYRPNGEGRSAQQETAAQVSGRSFTAGEYVNNAGEALADEASDIFRTAKDRSCSIVNEQIASAAEEVSAVAGILHRASDELAEHENKIMASVVSKVADGLTNLSDAFRDNDLEEITRKTKKYARANPGMFLGMSAAAGFLLARFFMSSVSSRTASGRGT